MGQRRIFAANQRQAANKFKKKYGNEDIYDVTREVPLSTPKNERFFRVTSVKKGRLPKSKLSKLNYPLIKRRR